ncbi:hypothetical protein [Bradyrhizobium sp. CB3481]|uniref:hypothetical protein n=1 Tax=Bradyrhizobium sp. CB3481 TaxID=3039158 RepID=UPI0024B0E72E|nr:hypothetical protein [Bradyrhizobium sp. CB3481]WFU18496.1 hypothetical protein QA643_09190 [Bradyrhizobium sp. CB3481]
MKFKAALIAGLLTLAAIEDSHAVFRIANDRGGEIGRYVYRYDKLRVSRQPIMIDGLCASACTIVLSAVSHRNICVTPRAILAFHAAWDFGRNGRAVTNPGATRMLYSMYPSPIQRWLDSRGGLTPRTVFLQGKQLEGMYRPCQR